MLRKSYSSSEKCIYPTHDRARPTVVENKPKNITVLSGERSTYSDITSEQPKQGHGSGNRNRGGNNNNKNQQQRWLSGNHDSNTAKKSSFKEASVKLKGNIFDISSG